MRHRGLGQIAAGGVQDALGLTGGPGSVENEQRMLGVVGHIGVLGGLLGDQLVPPQVASFFDVHALTIALDDDDVLHGVPGLRQGAVHIGLQR